MHIDGIFSELILLIIICFGFGFKGIFITKREDVTSHLDSICIQIQTDFSSRVSSITQKRPFDELSN